MDLFKQIQHIKPSSFSVRGQQRYRAEVSLFTIILNMHCPYLTNSTGSLGQLIHTVYWLCLAEDAHEAVYAHEDAVSNPQLCIY